MIGLKTGILSMSVGQKCKLWIPQRLTGHIDQDGEYIQHETDILIDITLINIIRSDIYKDTTYTNDIVIMGHKSRRKRANTVSKQAPPLTPMQIPSTMDNIPSTIDEFDEMDEEMMPSSTPGMDATTMPPTTPGMPARMASIPNYPSMASHASSRTSIKPTSRSPPNISPPLQPMAHRKSIDLTELNDNNDNNDNEDDQKIKEPKYSLVVNNIDEDKKEKPPKRKTTIVITPETPQSDNNSLDLSEAFPIPDLNGFVGGHLNHQLTDVVLQEHQLDMKSLLTEIGQNNQITMNLATPRMTPDLDEDGKSYVEC